MVLFEPALDMEVRLYKDGETVSSESLSEGEVITAQIHIIDPATGQIIPPSALPGTPMCGITIRDANGELSVATDKLEFTTTAGELEVAALASLPGYFDLRTFEQARVRLVELILDKPHGWSGTLANIKGMSPLAAQVVIDGRRATAGEMATMSINVSSDKSLKFDLEKDVAQGSFLVRPKQNLLKLLTPTGTTPVQLTLDTGHPGEQIAKSVNLTLLDMPWYQKLLWPFLLLSLCLLTAGYITKPRFDRQNAYIEHWSERKMGGITARPRTRRFEPQSISRFSPFTPEVSTVAGIKFKAGRNKDHIILPKSGQSKSMRVAGLGPLKDNAGQEDIIITPGTIIEVTKGDKLEKYRYRT